MIKRKINFPIKLVILGLIIISTLFFLIGYLVKSLKTSEYFKIKAVVSSKPQAGPDFSYLMGRNIFTLDLGKESRYISELHPVYREIRLVRLLPDRLFVLFTERQALAYVKLYRYFCVDSDLAVFEIPQELAETDLPVIVGLEKKIFSVNCGKQYNIKDLALAVNIIKEAKLNSGLKKYKIKRIDVTNPPKASFFMQVSENAEDQSISAAELLEVKIGQDNIPDKTRILADLLTQLKKDLDDIKYIDLKFREPVIKFKDAK